MRCLVPLLAILLVILSWARPARAQGVYFDDADPEIMVLGNEAHYEVGFRKSNGAIAYIIDKATGQRVSEGSRNGCLWGAVFPKGTPTYTGGCSYGAGADGALAYAWAPETRTLTLDYRPDAAAEQRVTAQVLVTASEGPWFEMRLSIENDWGHVLDRILFPSELVFIEDDIQQALLPFMPGVAFEPAFFEQDRSAWAKYPGYPGLFADYGAVSSTKGELAIYSLYGEGPIRPGSLGFIHDDEYLPDSTYYEHTFGVALDDGETWTTPWVRIHVGDPPLETALAYREANGLAAFASLRDKLGAHYEQVARSPLYKLDAVQFGSPFEQYAERLAGVPAPGIIHPTSFQRGGHDENYPDFLPPDSAWGTTAEMAAMFEALQARGFLVMPYINPTWWDDDSATLQNLPPDVEIADIAVLDQEGQPVYEYYGRHGGYVMSPHAPFVQERLAELVTSMTTDVPSDLVFEDQIGARPWLFDHNPASPHPMAYIEGWIEHTRVYSDTLLMTELGFDRLAETEVGLHGSVRLPQYSTATDEWWGRGTWRPFPLAPLMARDKVLFYQHDLAPETFTVNKEALTWNLAMGYMLSYDLASRLGGGLEGEWLDVVSALQGHVLGRYADERLTGFCVAEDVTWTAFEGHTVVANWRRTEAYDAGEHTLRARGALVTSDDGALTAGVFSRYNGVALSPGDHILIEERDAGSVTVRQPLGADTPLTLAPLAGGAAGDPVAAWGYGPDDELLGSVPVTATAEGLTFTYQQALAGEPVAYYRLARAEAFHLPMILKGVD